MTESNNSNEAEKTKLFVGGLAPLSNATEETFEEYFAKWGKVLSFQLIKDPNTQRSKGFGFITFETSDSASNCLNYSSHNFEGKSISVKPCKEKERHDRGPNHHYGGHYGGRVSHHHHHQNHNSYRPPMPHYMVNPHVHHGNHYGQPRPMGYWGMNSPQQQQPQHQGYVRGHTGYIPNVPNHDHHDSQSNKSSSSQHNHSGGRNQKERNSSGGENTSPGRPSNNDDDLQVFVGGLPHNAGEKDLSLHFSRFGIIEHVSVAKDKQGGEGHKGFAFVTFTNKEDRDKSLDHSDHRIKNRTLKVEKKKPSSRKDQPRQNYNSSLKNSNGQNFSHPRSNNMKYEKPIPARHNGAERPVQTHTVDPNGIISPELANTAKVAYQQPVQQPINHHMINSGQYMMAHPMQHHYQQSTHHMYPPQPMMYQTQQIFHPIPQVNHLGQTMITQGQDPHQVYSPYMMPPVVQQPGLMMQHQIQQGQLANSQPPISQSPHAGHSGGYYINAAPNQLIHMAPQPTQQQAPPVLQATTNDQATNQQPIHKTPGRSPTI